MSFIKYDRKGHAASECRQPKVERSQRPCFECGEKGHEAKACPNKRRARIKKVEATSGAGPNQSAAVLCVQVAGPRRPHQQQPNLGDFISASPRDKQRNGNRFQLLTMADLADAAASELAVAPSASPEFAVGAGFPPLSGGVKAQMTAEKSVVTDFRFET